MIAWYQSAILALIWPAIHSHLDLTYSVGLLSWLCSKLGHVHTCRVS